jgi:hypothetical protein
MKPARRAAATMAVLSGEAALPHQPAAGQSQGLGGDPTAAMRRRRPDAQLGPGVVPLHVVDVDLPDALIGAGLHDRQPQRRPGGPVAGACLDPAAQLGAAGRTADAEPAMEVGVVLVGDEDLGDVALGHQPKRHGLAANGVAELGE